MATAGHVLATDTTLGTLAKDTSVQAIGEALTGTGGVNESLAEIHGDLDSNGAIATAVSGINDALAGDQGIGETLEDLQQGIHDDLVEEGGIKDAIDAIADAIEALPNATQAAADNANAAAAAATAAIANLGGLVAGTYSASATYRAGDYVYNNSKVYRCKVDIETPEAWTAAHWQEVHIGDDVSEINRDIINIFSSKSVSIPSGSDLNDNEYTTPGNYAILNASIAANVDNYPFTIGGRIIVAETSNTQTKIMLAIANNEYGIAWRFYISNVWGNWVKPISRKQLEGDAILSFGDVSSSFGYDLDAFPNNSIVGYTTAQISDLVHFPSEINSGGLIITINRTNINAGKVQFIIPWSDNTNIAKRCYINGAFSSWAINFDKETVYTVGTGKDFSTLTACLDYITSDALRNTWSEKNRCVVKIDEGTFDMLDVITLYYTDSSRYQWGLYVPRCCTIKGAGKDKTKITMYYSGSDDYIRGHISPLNMPYESALEDLSISVKNVRYCVHSDGDAPFNRAWAMSNNKITVKNVYMEHLGYDETVPSYNAPACWGAGIRDNVKREFTNCEFIARECVPWFTHNTIGQTIPSEIVFDNCKFVNGSSSNYSQGQSYAGCLFLSWGTDVINNVHMKNCYANRPISLRTVLTYNENAKCDYYLNTDGKNFVTESTTNDSHKTDNWISRNCEALYSGNQIAAYTPVTITIDGKAVTYDKTKPDKGIALFDSNANYGVVVQTAGLIDLDVLDATGFSAGNKIGYEDGQFVLDNDTPILEALSAHIGKFI